MLLGNRYFLSLLRFSGSPLILTIFSVILIMIVDPPMRDLQAALARQSANLDGVGATYWFNWFGGISPGSYSLIVPALSTIVGSLTLLCLSTITISVLAYPISHLANNPTALNWSISIAAILNMLSGRVPFAVGSACAMTGVYLLQLRRPVSGAAFLILSGLATAIIPAFVGIIILPFLLFQRGHTRAHLALTIGVVMGIGFPYLLFGNPGIQPYSWTTLFWCSIIGIGVGASLLPTDKTKRWKGETAIFLVAPLAIVSAIVLFVVPSGVGANLSRLFYLVLPCFALYFSRKSLRMLAIYLSPAVIYATFIASSDQIAAISAQGSHGLYTPLSDRVNELVDNGYLDNHRLELVDSDTRAGNFRIAKSVPLARGWENQSDLLYNPMFYQKHVLDDKMYRDWLTENAVAYIAVSENPVRQQREEAELVRRGLDYLSEVWRNDDWRLYRFNLTNPIVPLPLILLESSPSMMKVSVPEESVGVDYLIRIRSNKYLTAIEVGPIEKNNGSIVCLSSLGGQNWLSARFPRPGVYVLSGKFSLQSALFK